jgi:hypothetical protein
MVLIPSGDQADIQFLETGQTSTEQMLVACAVQSNQTVIGSEMTS